MDWARACGFKVVAAGKGTHYEPHYNRSNPDNVWDILDKMEKLKTALSMNHNPWIPHITLAYFPDKKIDHQLVRKVITSVPETVRIDRLRVAFAGSYIDFPLKGTDQEPAGALVNGEPQTVEVRPA